MFFKDYTLDHQWEKNPVSCLDKSKWICLLVDFVNFCPKIGLSRVWHKKECPPQKITTNPFEDLNYEKSPWNGGIGGEKKMAYYSRLSVWMISAYYSIIILAWDKREMGETRNREYFSRKCRRKSIELCHCQIQRRLQWRLWLYCCSTCQKVSSSETAKNGLLHETIVIAGVRSYIKSYQRWSISTFHIKKINDSLYLYSEQIFMQ